MKYPIGIQDFRKIRNDGYVYLDKSEDSKLQHQAFFG